MADSELPARRYSDEEIARILKRATEMHRDDPSAPTGRSDGLTLAELQQVASEAGIDPTLVRRAAFEVDTPVLEESPFAGVIGADPTLGLERVLPGEIDDDDFEALVVEIQRSVGAHGQPSLLGRTLTWQADTPGRSRTTQVMVTSRDGETRIRIEERLHQLAGGLFGGLMGGVGGGMGLGVGVGVGLEVLGSALAAVAIPVSVLGLSYLGARTIFGAVARRRRRTLERLLDRLTDVVGRAVRDTLERPEEPDRLTTGG